MTFPVEITDDDKRYARLRHTTEPGDVRQGLIESGRALGLRTADVMDERFGSLENVLCVVIMRGGALLYPGFTMAFPQADFCVLGMRRTPGRNSVNIEYMTPVRRDAYQATVYIDCVLATGGTLLATRELLAGNCHTGHEVAAVVSAAATGTRTVHAAGINVVGFSLYEELHGQVVMPDMGALDAGDLFSGVAPHVPDSDAGEPRRAR